MKRLIRILIRSVLLSAFLVACAGFGLYWYQVSPKWVSTENAYIKTKMIAVSADVDGRSAKVMVSNNQFVSQGDLLFELEREPFQMDLDLWENSSDCVDITGKGFPSLCQSDSDSDDNKMKCRTPGH